MNLLDKPIITKNTFKSMEDMSYFIHSLIFDDLLIAAQKETNCFVLKSDEVFWQNHPLRPDILKDFDIDVYRYNRRRSF